MSARVRFGTLRLLTSRLGSALTHMEGLASRLDKEATF